MKFTFEDLAMDMLVEHEGVRLKPYRDTKGILTIGVGHNMEVKPLMGKFQDAIFSKGELTRDECMELLERDLDEVIDDLQTFSWFAGLSDIRKAAMCDMRFNLGHAKFRVFKHMLQALEAGNFNEAAVQMINSDWFEQVKQRGYYLAYIIKNDKEGS